MPTVISVEYQIFGYQGRNSTGELELFPTPRRLSDTLVAVAHGVYGVAGLLPEKFRHAIEWFEDNPPDAVVIPEYSISPSVPTAYRDKGLITKNNDASLNLKKSEAEVAVRRVFYSGPIEYYWKSELSPEMYHALNALCAEVAWLGERQSVASVLLGKVDDIPECAYRATNKRFVPSGTSISLNFPTQGRLKAQEGLFASNNPKRVPTASGDKFKIGEKENNLPLVTDYQKVVNYVAPATNVYALPWISGFLFDAYSKSGDRLVPWIVKDTEMKDWALAFHRTLIRKIYNDIPECVTGNYADQRARPANNVSIQLIHPNWPSRDGSKETTTFLVAVPRSASPSDVRKIARGLQQIQKLYRKGHGSLVVNNLRKTTLTNFWDSEKYLLSSERQITPLMVSESRPRTNGGVSGTWAAEDSVRLSVGHALRDQLELGGSDLGAARHRTLNRAVAEAGVTVVGVKKFLPFYDRDYLHKFPKETQMATFVKGRVDLKEIVPAEAFIAIGQTRHLGGGLLVPQILQSKQNFNNDLKTKEKG